MLKNNNSLFLSSLIKFVFFQVLFLFYFVGATDNLDDVLTGLLRLGSNNKGWSIPKNLITENSVCYCASTGEDINFDFALIEHFNASVYSFNPVPNTIQYIQATIDIIKHGEAACCNNSSIVSAIDANELDKFSFFPMGLWDNDVICTYYGSTNSNSFFYSVDIQETQPCFEAPCKKLSTIMYELGHSAIDLLKLDIGGAEYPVLLNLIKEGILPKVLCITFYEVKNYNKSILLEKLIDAGYGVLHVHNETDYTLLLDTDKQQDILLPVKKKKIDQSDRMKVYEYCTDLFSQDEVTTEYYAYQLLKEEPLYEAINYLAVPWTTLINRRQLGKVPQKRLGKKNKGFTICQNICFEQIIPILKTIGIDTLFTPHVARGKKYNGIVVLPFPHYAVNGIEPAEKKDIWCSFIGFNTHKTRTVLFNLPKREDVVIIKRNQWHFWQPLKQKEQEKSEYEDILARSRFSLCPRGVGPSTIRFWESLRAGAIPVFIADDMTLPDGFNWDSCIVRVAEKDTHKIFDILNAISIEQEEMMRKNCLYCYALFSGSNFVSVIRRYYARR